MYRDLLGDCFLLRFPSEIRDVFVLIDCGVFLGVPHASERMQRIARDVQRMTDGKIDVLVITHEHWDHLSGFSHAKDIFDEVEIGELWLAWTENGDDPDAQKLRERRKRASQLLFQWKRALEARVGSHEDCTGIDARAFDRLIGFLGPSPTPELASNRTTSGILETLKKAAKRKRFCEPGTEPHVLSEHTGVRVYVLGPPRDEALLRRSNPRQGEVYALKEDFIDLCEDLCTYLPVDAPGSRSHYDRGDLNERSWPFDRRYTLTSGEKSENGDVDPGRAALFDTYIAPQNAWRRVDRDWLGAVEELALKLDNDTNNTSLVLAFDLSPEDPDGPILFFPGDAQVGNWLSWGSLRWTQQGADGVHPKDVTVQDLLRRTTLYKVGHHGSHNATLREQGLELMTHPDLVAMLPVEEAFARKKLDWDMPFASLLERLETKTKGRLLRADRAKAQLRRNGLEAAVWQAFLDRVREGEDGLYIEYEVLVPGS